MRQLLFAIAFLSLASACDPQPADGARGELVGATATADYEASVFIRSAAGGRCSGSLVHPRIVVTAWHCMSADTMQVDVTTTAGATTAYDVVDRFVHPGAFVADIEHFALDVAVLVLDRDVTGVVPYVLAYDGLADRVDAPLRAVAFGGGSSLFGLRQTSTGTLICDARREGSDFNFPFLTTIDGAPGDSGGSILDADGALLGVISGMIFGGCIHAGSTYYSVGADIWAARVEVSADLVEAAFVSVGATPPTRPSPDAGVAVDAGGALDAGGASLDAGGSTDGGTRTDAALPSDGGGARADAGVDAGSAVTPPSAGGCAIGVARATQPWAFLWLLLPGIAIARSRSRRRER